MLIYFYIWDMEKKNTNTTVAVSPETRAQLKRAAMDRGVTIKRLIELLLEKATSNAS